MVSPHALDSHIPTQTQSASPRHTAPVDFDCARQAEHFLSFAEQYWDVLVSKGFTAVASPVKVGSLLASGLDARRQSPLNGSSSHSYQHNTSDLIMRPTNPNSSSTWSSTDLAAGGSLVQALAARARLDSALAVKDDGLPAAGGFHHHIALVSRRAHVLVTLDLAKLPKSLAAAGSCVHCQGWKNSGAWGRGHMLANRRVASQTLLHSSRQNVPVDCAEWPTPQPDASKRSLRRACQIGSRVKHCRTQPVP